MAEVQFLGDMAPHSAISPDVCSLPRAPLFLAQSAQGSSPILLWGEFEFPLASVRSDAALLLKVVGSQNLSQFAPLFSQSELHELFEHQYSAASEYIYGHPIWEDIRNGSKCALHAYLLETRHYLAAAASRMAPSIGFGIGLSPLSLLLARHLLEEWDHATFYNDALTAIGCVQGHVCQARPMPTTLEWIHLTRAIAAKDGLAAAMCSGLLEHSSTEIEVVRAWHDAIVRKGLLSDAANAAILKHVDTDIGFAHSQNWKHALATCDCITPRRAADLLNDVSCIAEMIYRWLSSLKEGRAATIVTGMQMLAEEQIEFPSAASTSSYEIAMFTNLPPWPSALMEAITWNPECDKESASSLLTGLTYAFGNQWHSHPQTEQPLVALLKANCCRLARIENVDRANWREVDEATTQWLCSIDGHELWGRMMQPQSHTVVIGYMLENYFYLASAARHIGAAIASCTHANIRVKLIEHLRDELLHSNLLKSQLVKIAGIEALEKLRPLSTTVAFIGYLERLGTHDWEGYIVAGAFLQKSLSVCRETGRHSDFYNEVVRSNPANAELLLSMWRHDEIDEELDHDHRPAQLLSELICVEPLSADSLGAASVVPALAWSFLDGIVKHYKVGEAAIFQRNGWHAC